MMDYPLTVNTIFRRAERMCGQREIVTRRADKSIHRYTYADFARRNFPVAIWLPWRKFSRLLICPACSHRTWVSVSWHPQGS